MSTLVGVAGVFARGLGLGELIFARFAAPARVATACCKSGHGALNTLPKIFLQLGKRGRLGAVARDHHKVCRATTPLAPEQTKTLAQTSLDAVALYRSTHLFAGSDPQTEARPLALRGDDDQMCAMHPLPAALGR